MGRTRRVVLGVLLSKTDLSLAVGDTDGAKVQIWQTLFLAIVVPDQEILSVKSVMLLVLKNATSILTEERSRLFMLLPEYVKREYQRAKLMRHNAECFVSTLSACSLRCMVPLWVDKAFDKKINSVDCNASRQTGNMFVACGICVVLCYRYHWRFFVGRGFVVESVVVFRFRCGAGGQAFRHLARLGQRVGDVFW